MAVKKAQLLADERGFQAYLDEAKKELELQLLSLGPLIDQLRLRRQIEYALQTRGKQLRYVVVLLGGESVGGDRQTLQKMALAVELLHSASLVHDDVLDRDVFRRNVLSVQAKWGVREAVLVGDALASLALGLCKGYRQEILDLMAGTCLQLSDGEYMDMDLTRAAFSERNYLERVKKKTASLFKAAAQCGALVAEGTSGEVEALGTFGENYGTAFQMRDDVADDAVTEEFRVTLPIIQLYKSASKKDKLFLENLASQKGLSASGKGAARDDLLVKLEKCGALPYCSEKIDLYVEKAVASLSSLRESQFRGYLAQMAESLRLVQPS